MLIYSVKESCRLLCQQPAESDWHTDDWIESAKISVRARCLLRRAGFILAELEEPDTPITAAKVNPYVPRVDALAKPGIAFNTAIVGASFAVISELRSHTKARTRDNFETLFADFSAKDEAVLDLYYMLTSIGYAGGTDPLKLIRYLYEHGHP